MKLLLIKLAAEIFLKGGNKKKFENKLKDNMNNILGGMEYEFIFDQNRWFIKCESIDIAIEKLKKVFGIYQICIVEQVPRKIESIEEQVLKFISNYNNITFKVETKRANKEFPLDSLEVSRYLGSAILEKTQGLKVDIHKPELFINVEIREFAYIYEKKINGLGGLPYGMSGKTMLMLSGGIDSPVAGYMMGKRGVEISAVYYHSHPYTSEQAKEKVIELAKILKGYTMSMKLYVVSFTEIQKEIMEKCREEELTIIMRRFMMRIACKLANNLNIQSVTTGESVSQVASQTMESLVVTDSVADRPAFRPLIAMDKVDIMDLAEKIGTYETSILPYEDCCTIFVPKHPKTKPRLDIIERSESILEIEDLVERAIGGMEYLEIT